MAALRCGQGQDYTLVKKDKGVERRMRLIETEAALSALPPRWSSELGGDFEDHGRHDSQMLRPTVSRVLCRRNGRWMVLWQCGVILHDRPNCRPNGCRRKAIVKQTFLVVVTGDGFSVLRSIVMQFINCTDP